MKKNDLSTVLKNKSALTGFVATIIALLAYLFMPFVNVDGSDFTITDILSNDYYSKVLAHGLTYVVMWVPIVGLMISLFGFMKSNQNVIVRGAEAALLAAVAFPIFSLLGAVEYVKDTVSGIFGSYGDVAPELKVSFKHFFEYLSVGFWVTLAALLTAVFTLDTTPYYVFETRTAPSLDKEELGQESAALFCANCGKAYEATNAKFCANCGAPRQTTIKKSTPPTEKQPFIFTTPKTIKKPSNVCKACGATMKETDEECPLCGMPK